MKLKKKNIAKQFVATVLIIFLALSVLAGADTVKAKEAETTVVETESEATEQEDTETERPDAATDNTVSYEGEGYAVTCNIINSWGEGYTAEVSIKNTSDKKIHNWNLMFALDGEILSIWNAKISSRNEDGLYTIEGESYNSNINPGSAVSFGFNASGSQEIPEFHFSQSVQMPVEEGDFEVDYAVSDDWETGFVGEIGILNRSSKSFKDWCITFDWDNDIDGIWNAKIVSHEENHYVISCEEYNRIIEAGQRVQFGFSCPSSKSSSQPENIAVSHFTDGDGKEEDNGDAEDEIDPSEVTEYVDIEFQNGNCAQSVLDDMQFVNYAPELLDVAWVSSDESVVTNDGHVTRGGEDRTVTVTAGIQYKGKDYKKEFTLTVKRKTDIDVDTLQDYSLSQLEQMNCGDEDYDVDVNDYRYLESIYGTYSEIKVDSYETALFSLYNIRSLLGIGNPFEELRVTDVKADEAGYIFKFNQMYRGLQVIDSGITVSSDENGKVDYLDSGYFPVLNELNTSPQITRDEAVKIAEQDGYRKVESDEEGDEGYKDLQVFNEYGKGSIVWSLVCQKQGESYEVYEVLVDARIGEIICAFNMAYDMRKKASGEDILGKTREFYINKKGFTFINPKYRLEDTKYKIEIYNAKHGIIGKNAKLIEKSDNFWSKTEVSAMANMECIYDYFKKKYKLKSYDNKGSKIKVYIYTSIEDNAYWNGHGIWIGKGTGWTFKEISLAAGMDVMAHEFTHAIIENKTNLRNKGTVGIINEAYADIFGCYTEGNWEMGEEVTVGDCLRNLKNPEDSGNAQKVGGKNYVRYDDFSVENDFGGVHVNSTVISHVAYMMEKEKKQFSVEPEKIWYESLCLGYKKHSDLYDVRKKVIKAAEKLKSSKRDIKRIETLFDEANIMEENCDESDEYYKKLDKEIKNSKKLTYLEDNYQIIGKVVVADKDFDFSNNMILDSVQVKDAFGKEIVKTDERGNYLADVKEDNPVMLHFSKDGYLDETMYVAGESIIGQNTHYCDLVELIPEADKGKGKADGFIRDSVTWDGIKGLKVCIRKGINNIYTNPEAIIESEQGGYYQTPELEAGNYCLEISSSDEKYMSAYFNIKIFGGSTIKNQNISMSDSLEDNQMRVVLTWGEKPRDLDSHLIYHLSNGEDGHIYYNKPESMVNNVCIAKLDRDDTKGYGPETTTIYDDETGDYTFYVENFSKETGLGDGNAMVKVYLGNQQVPLYTFTVPDGRGKIWTVFKYNSAAGRLSVINELGSQVK